MKKKQLRNTLVFASCATMMLLSATACSNGNNNTGNNVGDNAGTNAQESTYTGTAQGYGGDVNVTIGVVDGKITAVTAEGESETPEIGGNAIGAFNEDGFAKIIGSDVSAVNGDSIDAVTGATLTSSAVKSALEAAIQKVQ